MNTFTLDQHFPSVAYGPQVLEMLCKKEHRNMAIWHHNPLLRIYKTANVILKPLRRPTVKTCS